MKTTLRSGRSDVLAGVKRSPTSWCAAVVLIMILVDLWSIPSTSRTSASLLRVRYLVTGTGNADLRLFESHDTNSAALRTNRQVTLPWFDAFTIEGISAKFSVSATARQNSNVAIGCTLEVDGRVIRTARASGLHPSVVCVGSGYD